MDCRAMINAPDQQAMYDYYNKRSAVGDAWGPPGRAGGLEAGLERERLAREEGQRFAADLKAVVRDRHVLELACGRGDSTAIAVETARSILATELAPEPLKVAMARGLPAARVRFEQRNAFDLLAIPGEFDAVIATGFFDHVPKATFDAFLSDLKKRVGAGGAIFLSGAQWTDRAKRLRTHREGVADSYMRRPLNDGTEYLILDNEFTEEELHGIFDHRGEAVKINYGRFWWWVSYQTAS